MRAALKSILLWSAFLAATILFPLSWRVAAVSTEPPAVGEALSAALPFIRWGSPFLCAWLFVLIAKRKETP